MLVILGGLMVGPTASLKYNYGASGTSGNPPKYTTDMDGCLVINLLLQLVFLIYNSLFNKN